GTGGPRLEPGYNPAGAWLQQLKLFALAAGDGGLPVWFDVLHGGTGGGARGPALEPGSTPAGEWLQQVKLFALAAGDGGLPVWFDVLHGGTGDSTTYAPQFAAFSDHVRLAPFLPLEDIILTGARKMPTAENQLTWLRLKLGYIGPMTLQDQHRQSLRDLLAAGRAWQALPYVAKRGAAQRTAGGRGTALRYVARRESAKPTAQRTGYRGLGHSVEVTDPEDLTRHWA